MTKLAKMMSSCSLFCASLSIRVEHEMSFEKKIIPHMKL